MQLDTTTIIIIITVLVSIGGFNNQKLIDDLIFYPPAVTQRRQWYRFFTCGLIHADIAHLAFNMLSLYFFGKNVEKIFIALMGKQTGILVYLLLYISALAVSLLPTYSRHKDDYHYRSLGASGAVSAIIFAGLFLIPGSEVFIFFIPIPIPGFIFAPLFLLISFYLDRKGTDNVNHSAHIWGSVYGVIFVIVMGYSVGFPVFENFINQIKSYMQIKGWTN